MSEVAPGGEGRLNDCAIRYGELLRSQLPAKTENVRNSQGKRQEEKVARKAAREVSLSDDRRLRSASLHSSSSVSHPG
jgi:hypothetical protein